MYNVQNPKTYIFFCLMHFRRISFFVQVKKPKFGIILKKNHITKGKHLYLSQ